MTLSTTASTTLISFTATFGLVDDNGVGYCGDNLLASITSLDVSIFTVAFGDGIDTQTGQREPVLVVQGSTTMDSSQLLAELDAMACLRNQRGIGFFVANADDSYHQTDLGMHPFGRLTEVDPF